MNKKETIPFEDRRLSLELYYVADMFGYEVNGYGVELWEDDGCGGALLHYAADFLNEGTALESFDHVKNNVADFID